MYRLIPATLIFLILAGCGETPRIDATDRATVKSSMRAMTDGMSEAKKKEFSSDLATLTFPSVMRKAMTPGQKADEVDLAKPVDGLTAAEIHDRAQAVRDGLRKK